MEGDDGPSAISNKPTTIKAAQEEMGKLDVLVCGHCHSVFHFIEEFKEHRMKEGACSQVSHFRENNDNGQKAQVWAFLLWKNTQNQQESADKDATNPWKLYQKWCKMDTHVRDSWITAGKTIQTFTKISNAKMQDSPRQIQANTAEGAKPILVRKVIRNGQPEEMGETKKDTVKLIEVKKAEVIETETDKKEKPKLKPSVKPKKSSKAATEEDADSSNEEYVVEKILAKRFNTKKRCSEYLLKWEGYSHENNTWEPAETVALCKNMLEDFERNLAKQKEIKAAQQQANTKVIGRAVPVQKQVLKVEASKPGPSTAAQAGRPMRSSKSKAMDQVKQWCGTMKEEGDEGELLGKRRMDHSDSDSEDGTSSAAKRTKADTGSDDEWTGESEDERLIGRSDVIQRAFNRANAQSNGSNKVSVSTTDLATSLGLQSPEGAKSSQPPVLVANAKGVVKVDPKQMPNLTSGVYVMSRKDGIIKLDSSPSGKLAVKGSPTQGVLMVQNRDNTNVVRKQVISTSQSNSMTPVKVVSKMDGGQVVTQMKVISKPITSKTGGTQKTEPIKIQPKPDPSQLQQIHVVTAVPAPITLQPRITTGIRPAAVTPQRGADGRPLLPRPALRATTPTSILGIRTPVRASSPRQIQPQTPRQVLQKRTTTVVSTQAVSPSTAGTVTQIRPKFTVLTTQPKQVLKTGTSSVQQIQKQSPKTPVGKTQSLLSPQQKLLMAKRKAQEAAGIIKPGGRGLLAGARVPAARGKGKVTETSTTVLQTGNKTKESKLAEGDGLHMEFHEVGSEESSSEGEPDLPPIEADTITAPEPDSPPRPFTLCPLTGRIIGPDGEPIEQPGEQEPEPTPSTTLSNVKTTASETTTDATAATTTTTTTTTAELVLPSLDSLTESTGIMRVEMSPGGTTGTIVQTSDTTQINLSNVAVSAPDLPCLDDTASISTVPVTVTSNIVASATPLTESTPGTDTSITTALSTVTATPTVTMSVTTADICKTEEKVPEERKVTDDASNLVAIAEHGVVYQVAGQAEDGQTLLVTRSADGEQQCVYVTTEQQGDDGSVLTLDHAVAEAVAQLIPDQVNLAPQFYVKEDGTEPAENSMVMSIMDNANATDVTGTQEDNDGQAQVVAQVVQADEPTPGGTRRVVLLLPDGNLMMTEVDEEQYAALELDK